MDIQSPERLQSQPHLFIIGAGAIGKALAVFLQLAGRSVTLLRGSVDDGSSRTERIRVESESVCEADVEIATLKAFEVIEGIVVLANKSYGNDQLATTLKDKTGSSPLVLLQNGLGVEQPFLTQGFPEVYRCVLFVTSQSLDDVTIRFKPVSVCPVGIERGNTGRLNYLVQQLNTPEFAFRSEAHIQPVIWKKAIVNCVFNSVCPLLEVDNGIFHRSGEAFKMARRIIAECVLIAGAKGIKLHSDEVEASLLQISRLSDGQTISTLQDIRNSRRTEIETLNPEIVRIAGSLHLEEAVRETRLLGELTRLKADLNRQSTLTRKTNG